MGLSDISAKSIADSWSLLAKAPFSPIEQNALAEALIALSAEVTVHIVPDKNLTAEEQDYILSDRAVSCLEDWAAIAARTFRRQFAEDANWRAAHMEVFPVGLKSATRQERIDLPVLGGQLSDRLARYLVQNPDATFDDLENVSGIGPAGLNTLRESSYIDRPSIGVLSPTIQAFVDQPDIETLIQLFDTTDFTIVYGDWNTHRRRDLLMADTGSAQRLRTFIAFVTEQMKSAPFVARGVLASDAIATAERQKALKEKRDSATTGKVDLVINDAYAEAALSMIESATTSVSLMVFLGTDASPVLGGVSPEVLIDALESANESLDVRVVLDQDDIDDPYLSKAINMSLFNRLKAAGVAVKFDEQNVLLHSKLLIADGSTALVGSHNWTRASFTGTHEVSLLLQQVEIAQTYQDRFDALWVSLPA